VRTQQTKAITAALVAVVLSSIYAVVWAIPGFWRLIDAASIGIVFVPIFIGLAGGYASEIHVSRLKSDPFWLFLSWVALGLGLLPNVYASSSVLGLFKEWFKFGGRVVDVSSGMIVFWAALGVVTTVMASLSIRYDSRETFSNFLARATLTMNAVVGLAFTMLIFSGSASLRATTKWW
jgi:hypothetical protein